MPASSANLSPGEDLTPGPASFRPDAPQLGQEVVRLSLADIEVRLEGLDPATAGLLRARFGPEAGEEHPRVVVSVRESDAPRFLRRLVAGESYRLEARPDGNARLVWSYGFAARYDPSAGHADLRLAPEEEDARALSLENFLRALVSWLALEDDSFLLHAAGLETKGRAFAFFGPSEAGKTTVCRLSEGRAKVLNDDLLLVRRRSSGWEAAALPFTGAFRGAGRGSWPLAALFRLIQAAEHRVEEISPALCVGEVLSSIPFMEECPPDATLLERVGRLAREVPVRRLHFRPDPGFWEVIESWS
jgi:hypothetical protein